MSDRHNHKRAFNSQSTYNPSRPNDRRSLGNPNESKSDYTGRTKSDVKNRDRLNQSAMELPNNNIEQKRRKIMCKKYPQTPDAWEKYWSGGIGAFWTSSFDMGSRSKSLVFQHSPPIQKY